MIKNLESQKMKNLKKEIIFHLMTKLWSYDAEISDLFIGSLPGLYRLYKYSETCLKETRSVTMNFFRKKKSF